MWQQISAAVKRVLRFGVGRDLYGTSGEFLDHASEDHAVDRAQGVPTNKSKKSLGRCLFSPLITGN
jgi:hypothetical protein